MRQLKKWNGRGGGGKQGTFYIAAYSQKQAAELYVMAGGYQMGSIGEIQKYYSNTWGIAMNGIEPQNPCVYHAKDRDDKPKLIVEIK